MSKSRITITVGAAAMTAVLLVGCYLRPSGIGFDGSQQAEQIHNVAASRPAVVDFERPVSVLENPETVIFEAGGLFSLLAAAVTGVVMGVLLAQGVRSWRKTTKARSSPV